MINNTQNIQEVDKEDIDLSSFELKDKLNDKFWNGGKLDILARKKLLTIARAMIKRGYVTSIQEAFSRYLNRGRPAYVERYKISITETISLIKKIGGISVLAHPGLLKDKSIINYCIELGIDGIECIHSKHSQADIDLMSNIAKENDLIATGGSDFHGDLVNGNLLLGKYYIDIENIPEMRGRI